jgi:iron complex outermembrane receptor protein
MRAIRCLCIVFLFLSNAVRGQDMHELSGKVLDENNLSLPGAYVVLNNGMRFAVTGSDGYFLIQQIPTGHYVLTISFLGYQKYTDTLFMGSNQHIVIHLRSEVRSLNEVVIKGDYAALREKQEPMSVEIVEGDFIRSNMAGSLMKSLERLPGISAIEIGSGQSKPVIRGLGFNRVVVVENGIKHEGQQWGADHGLEIDQYTVDRVEVIKGPASFMYGSDAIGGIIKLDQTGIPNENEVGGSVDLTGKTNNNLLGLSANVYARKQKLFCNSRITLTDYADYRVPTDSVDIYSYRIPLDKNRLRNTAGNEQVIHLVLGLIGDHSLTRLFISDLRNKTGFFANAHGLEPRMVDTDLHDKSDRDVHYPYQKVNHFKLTAKSNFTVRQKQFESEIGYQRNFRQEWSQYVSHGYMPAVSPENFEYPADLELQFEKDVYAANLKGTFDVAKAISVSSGFSSEYQNNRIGGRGFIIPEFRQFTFGSFLYGKANLSTHVIIHAGLRYDYGRINTDEYFDWFQSPLINDDGDTTGFANLQRAESLTRTFNSLCWSLGLNYNKDFFSFKANVGKSFRMPIAKELAANGVNYHHFCYEIGNPNLKAEVSYQIDLGLEWNYPSLVFSLNPFVNYFPDYIFLNPSYEHDYLYGAGNQVYYYTQSEVIRFGGELGFRYELFRQLKVGLTGEYIYSEQLSGEKQGYSLPFSPPANLLFNLKYTPDIGRCFYKSSVSVDWNVVAAQNKVVPPEEKTPGYQMFDISAGSKIRIGEQMLSIDLQIRNLFNVRYFNHTNYYRIIHVPEPGRNLIINITIPFAHQLKHGKN